MWNELISKNENTKFQNINFSCYFAANNISNRTILLVVNWFTVYYLEEDKLGKTKLNKNQGENASGTLIVCTKRNLFSISFEILPCMNYIIWISAINYQITLPWVPHSFACGHSLSVDAKQLRFDCTFTYLNKVFFQGWSSWCLLKSVKISTIATKIQTGLLRQGNAPGINGLVGQWRTYRGIICKSSVGLLKCTYIA